MLAAAAFTCSSAKLGPFVPPRRMICTSWLPFVRTIEAKPCAVTPMNAWGLEAARIASTATLTLFKGGFYLEDGGIVERRSPVLNTYLPSVPFLKPIGKETPEASSRCSCDSVVRAPIAPQEITIRRRHQNRNRFMWLARGSDWLTIRNILR